MSDFYNVASRVQRCATGSAAVTATVRNYAGAQTPILRLGFQVPRLRVGRGRNLKCCVAIRRSIQGKDKYMWPHTLQHSYLRPEFDPNTSAGAWNNQITHGRPIQYASQESWPALATQQYYTYGINGTHTAVHGQAGFSSATQWPPAPSEYASQISPWAEQWRDPSRQSNNITFRDPREASNNTVTSLNSSFMHNVGRESLQHSANSENANNRHTNIQHERHNDSSRVQRLAAGSNDLVEVSSAKANKREVIDNDPELSSRPKAPDPFFDFCPGLGAFVKEDSNGEACVDYILPGGAFDTVGIQVGDVLLEIEGSPVLAARDVVEAGKKWQDGTSRTKKTQISVVIKRNSDGAGYVCKTLGPEMKTAQQQKLVGSSNENIQSGASTSRQNINGSQTPRRSTLEPSVSASETTGKERDDENIAGKPENPLQSRTFDEIIGKARKAISDDIVERARKSIDYSFLERKGNFVLDKSVKFLGKHQDSHSDGSTAHISHAAAARELTGSKMPKLQNIDDLADVRQLHDVLYTEALANDINVKPKEEALSDSKSKSSLNSEFHREMGKVLVEKHKKAAEEHSSAVRAALYQEAKEWAKMELERRKAKFAVENAIEKAAQAEERKFPDVSLFRGKDTGKHLANDANLERSTTFALAQNSRSAKENLERSTQPIQKEILREIKAKCDADALVPPSGVAACTQGEAKLEGMKKDLKDENFVTSVQDHVRTQTSKDKVENSESIGAPGPNEQFHAGTYDAIEGDPQRIAGPGLPAAKERREKVEEVLGKKIQHLIEKRTQALTLKKDDFEKAGMVPETREVEAPGGHVQVKNEVSPTRPGEEMQHAKKDSSPVDAGKIEDAIKRFESELKSIVEIDWSIYGPNGSGIDVQGSVSDVKASNSVGVGLMVERQPATGLYQVVRIAPDGPAFGKMKSRDTIISIDGLEVSFLTEEEVTNRFKGTEGSIVNLVVDRKLPWPYLVKERHVVQLTRGSGKSVGDEHAGTQNGEDLDTQKGSDTQQERKDTDKMGTVSRLFVKHEDLSFAASALRSGQRSPFHSDHMLCGDLMITITSEGWTQALSSLENPFLDLRHL